MIWRQIVETCDGYLHPLEGPMLAEWAAKSTGVLVEIGSFAGKSTIWIASGAKHPVIAVDHHRGNPEMQPGAECFIEAAWDPVAERIDSLPLFRRNLEAAGFAHKVYPVAAPSEKVARWWSTPIGFLFVDGDHDNARRDVEQWVPHLTGDGILALHDTAVPDVSRAVRDVEAAGWVERAMTDDCLRIFTR